MVFAFLALVLADPVGVAIDMGSYHVKSVIVPRNGQPEIGLNYQSKRATPGFIGFRAKAKFNATMNKPIDEDDVGFLTPDFGEKALTYMDVRPYMGSGYFTALAGLEKQAAIDKAKSLFVSTTAARVSYNDLVPLFLKSYIDCVAKGHEVEHLTLVFPSYFTAYQRQTFEQAADVCGFKNYSEMDDVDAVAMNYEIEKVAKFAKSKRRVLFVDVGATSIKGYVIEFEVVDNVPVARRLSYVVDTKSGGAYLTADLVELLKEKIQVTHTTDAENRRLFTAAEKIKVELTLLKESTALVDEINGIDRSITVTRSELEDKFVMKGLAKAVIDVAKKASDGIQFDDLEIIGGSSRIPFLQDAIKQTFRIDNIGHSLNADEAIVFGAAYQTQYSMKVSQFKQVVIEDLVQPFRVEMEADDKNLTLCEPGKPCVTNVSLTRNVWDVTIRYLEGPFDPNLSVTSQRADLPIGSQNHTVLRFHSRPFRLLGADECNETCAPGELERRDLPPLNRELVGLFLDSRQREERFARIKNELEQLSIRVLDEIAKNQTIRTFTNYSQRIEIIRCAEKHKEWVRSSEAQKLTDVKEFSVHLRDLKRCIGPVYKRIHDNRTFWSRMERVWGSVQMAKQLVPKWEERGNPADGKDIFRFSKHLEVFETWMNATMKANMKGPKTEPLKVSTSEIDRKCNEFEHEFSMMQDIYGGAGSPRIMRGDGTTPTKEQLKELEKTNILKGLRQMRQKYDPATGKLTGGPQPDSQEGEDPEEL